MRVTLSQIAAKAGVSKNAVSMALRNHPRISAERRLEIQRLAAEMGYVADPFLRRLSLYRTGHAGYVEQGIIAWLNHWEEAATLRSYREFELYWRGAQASAKRLGYRLEEIRWPQGCPVTEIEKTLDEKKVLGLLLPPHKPQTDWGNFDWSRFSIIRFGLSVARPDTNLVTSDHQRAVVMAMKRMHEYGYRRIGFVLSEEHDRSMGGNYSGAFLWAQQFLQLDPIPPLTKESAYAAKGKDGFNAALAEWLERHRPDAILNSTIECFLGLRELGYRIPQDIAVAATSMYDLGVDAGIDQHSRAIGRIAAEMLIKQITLNERGEPANPSRILVESRWHDGRSLPCRSGNGTRKSALQG